MESRTRNGGSTTTILWLARAIFRPRHCVCLACSTCTVCKYCSLSPTVEKQIVPSSNQTIQKFARTKWEANRYSSHRKTLSTRGLTMVNTSVCDADSSKHLSNLEAYQIYVFFASFVHGLHKYTCSYLKCCVRPDANLTSTKLSIDFSSSFDFISATAIFGVAPRFWYGVAIFPETSGLNLTTTFTADVILCWPCESSQLCWFLQGPWFLRNRTGFAV